MLKQSGVTYQGSREEKLGMALGGLGTATMEIGRDGAFQHLRIQNDWTGTPKPTAPGTFLSVHARADGGGGAGNILQLDAPEGLQPVQDLTYTGRFPFVEIEYHHDALPCQVTLEAFSPFVPLDAEASSLPLVFFTVRLCNCSQEPIKVSAAMSWTNNIGAETWERGRPSEGNRNTVLEGEMPAVLMDTRMEELAGSEYLLSCLPAQGVKYSAVADWWKPQQSWLGPNVGRFTKPENVAALWQRFLDEGLLPPEAAHDDRLGKFSPHQPVAAVAGEVELAPGEEQQVRFALIWFFPYHFDRQGQTRAVNLLGHQYATRFPGGARQVADWAFARHELLRTRSEAWRRLIEESSLPPHTRALMTETLYLLPRISWWLADGRFCLYESINCPRVHPTILDIYMAPVMAPLFPELHALALRNIADAQLESGEIPSTLGVNSILRHEYRVFNSGDCCVFPITTTWQMLWGADEQFVADMYPVMKSVLQWGTTLDHDGDGVPDCHGIDQGWDTFPMFGAAAYIADQWMAGLLAGESMAQYLGDDEFVRWCVAIRRQAADTVESRLWNGAYYDLCHNPATGENTDICFLEQFTYGTLAATILQLGPVHPPERIRKALHSMWKLNVEPARFVARMGSNSDGTPADQTVHKQQQGSASQSNSFTPVSAAPYAAVAIQHGMVEEGLALVEEMAEVIIKQVQEPWRGLLLFSSETGQWFYGEHYSDCLIVWDIMHALLGVHVNMLERSLTLAPPRLPVKMPVFGRLYCGQVEFALDQQGVTLTLTNSADQQSLIRTLTVRLPGEVQVGDCSLIEGNIRSIETTVEGVTILSDIVIPATGRLALKWLAG